MVLADVQRLIQARNLNRAYADTLHPYVREEFFRLWGRCRPQRRDTLHSCASAL